MTPRSAPQRGFFDPRTGGPPVFELRRDGPRVFRLVHPFAYRDERYDDAFVCPADTDTFTTDLNSVPAVFSWIVPTHGTHLPAILLHDALVVPHGEPPTHEGPKVSREEADRIMRDAMGALGVRPIRRWLAWTGASLATIVTTPHRRGWWRTAIAGHLLFLALLGVLATIDLADVASPLPWMGGRGFWIEITAGVAVGLAIPIALAILWGPRWRVMAITGVAVALLLHVTVTMTALWVLYELGERVVGLVSHRSDSRAEA